MCNQAHTGIRQREKKSGKKPSLYDGGVCVAAIAYSVQEARWLVCRTTERESLEQDVGDCHLYIYG